MIRRLLFAAVAAATLLPAPRPAAAAQCGVERWAIKTLSDPRAKLVDFTPHPTSVAKLRAVPRPARLDQRIQGVETTTYRVRVALIAMKREDDSDIHLVVADPRNTAHTMIVEFPAPDCAPAASATARTKMQTARSSLQAACGSAGTTSFTALNGSAKIDGIGFFDFKHGQRGVAPNAIELHPVTRFSATTCTSA